MATHVYANGQEIACKATEGVAPSAFPDPCWSPPPPPAGPVVVPYSNSTDASRIRRGTCTVFIAGQTVAIADYAYFVTSTGNEPATHAFGKGLATGALKGKAYFRSWSMNVKFEGLGVARHLDLVSHNHGSMPSNTPVFPYVSRGWLGGHDCKKEEERITKACAADKDNTETQRDLKKKSKFLNLLQRRKTRSNVGRRDSSGWHWTDDHCAGLEVSLRGPGDAKRFAEDLATLFESLPSELEAMAALESVLMDMAVNAAMSAAAKVAAKAAVKQLAGSSVPLVGNIAMGLWTAVDAALAVGSVVEIKAAANEALEQLDVLRAKRQELQSLAEEFKDFKRLSLAEQAEQAQRIATEGQDLLATLNACTRARKCNLVPYSNNAAGNPFRSRGRSKVEPANGGGCCKGQTGHHLIYGAMVRQASPPCSNYNHGIAPTVCVEGHSQHFGSHKRIHDEMDRQTRELFASNAISTDTMSVEQAIEAATSSLTSAFPLSGCSAKCIRAQLRSYYGQMCRGSQFKVLDKNGNTYRPDSGNRADR